MRFQKQINILYRKVLLYCKNCEKTLALLKNKKMYYIENSQRIAKTSKYII